MSDKIKTVDNLGPKTSIDFAKREQYLDDIKKYKNLPPSIESGSISQTPTNKIDELLGNITPKNSVFFPFNPIINTLIGAFQNGQCSKNIGFSEELKTKIENAPQKLKTDVKNFSKMQVFSDFFTQIDNDCNFIYKLLKEFTRG